MKAEQILEAIGRVDERYIAEAFPEKGQGARVNLRRLVPAAAGFVLIAVVGAVGGQLWSRGDGGRLQPSNPFSGVYSSSQQVGAESESTGTDSGQDDAKNQEFVEIASLLEMPDSEGSASSFQNSTDKQSADVEDVGEEDSVENSVKKKSASDEDEVLMTVTILLFGHTASYEKVSQVNEGRLKDSAGSVVPDTGEAFYRVSGHEDYQYLIRLPEEESGEYSLWRFRCFTDAPYGYREVLEQVYALTSPEQIEEIMLSPVSFDNSDAGRRAQESVGTTSIKERGAIQIFYRALMGLTCLGENQWEHIHDGRTDIAGDGETDAAGDGGGNASAVRATRLGREVRIHTSYGNDIDSLIYTGVSDMFYENGGIAYRPLTGEQAGGLRALMGIQE